MRFLKRLTLFITLLFVVFGSLYAYARYWEPFHLNIKEVSISSPYVSSEAEGMVILAMADSHLGEYYSLEQFQLVIDEVNRQEPDMVVFAGDLFDHFARYEGDPALVSEALARINAPQGKFAVFGNHDYGGGAEFNYQSIMEAGGFTVLKNQYQELKGKSMSIIGIDDLLIGYGDTRIGSYARPDYFNLFLAHEPDIVSEMMGYNLDLMISGHTHGKQVDLGPLSDNVLPPYGKTYVKGLYEMSNERLTRLYVNAGIGMTILPFRFHSPPELTLITLNSN